MALPAMPPSLSGRPPMGAGPIAVKSGNPGDEAKALTKVREAIKILEGALPDLQAGSKPYTAVLEAINKISKHVSPGDAVPGVQQTALRDLAQAHQQDAMMNSLMKTMNPNPAAPGGNAPGLVPPVPSGAGPGANPAL